MKVLVIGSGGREHALVWKIAQSPKVDKIFCAPGNAGIAPLAASVPIKADDVDGLLEFAAEEQIDLTVVGPEAPLSLGIVDRFEAAGLKVFGAGRDAARLETSKGYAKEILLKYNIPTARGRCFDDYDEALAYLKELGGAVVVKADGLAAGKGVFVCNSEKQAADALRQIMKDRLFGDAGNRVVIEERLEGEEASFIALTDGETVLPMPCSQDHKAVGDGDTGPNTGGMGAYSPAPVVDEYLHRKIMETVMVATVKAMAAEGVRYRGVLYAGLMISGGNVRVLEFNARFGDPEAQPLLMRVKNDIVPVLEAVCENRLHEHTLEIDDRAAVCVVMASGGYPGAYKKGMAISGLSNVNRMKDVVAFHAGTRAKGKKVVTDGGRVLGVTALGKTVEDAIRRAYEAVAKISWEGAYHRNDIGHKALKRLVEKPRVSILMGSDSDLKIMEEAAGVLQKFGVAYEMTVASAHRTPARVEKIVSTARERGIQVFIAGAGMAAHLAGVIASHTTLPVIGVPIDASPLNGLDALLSTVQMPPGVPVATVAVGKAGAKNAGFLAIQIMAVSDETLAAALSAHKKDMAADVEKKAQQLGRLQA
ncbi:phosphoribosylamine--glycine ligase [Desulfosudis oleivorans]|uniref:Multifunctional fusion protein n=1 Tax=Desulfosudis oleivorans (strain DSM 6200 / JCM 39069 / Hxd3) TaxID=96561 RepID=A8ZZ78_DESOH|nr:phosphoribosylamine--glycine ligase [Desulfosudis oleivorans]ABW67231.1 phosphoribosylamine--glycine ligase [Desulfosudis oleivorans Hxd3]